MKKTVILLFILSRRHFTSRKGMYLRPRTDLLLWSLVSVLLGSMAIPAFSQIAGDENNEMFNQLRNRDQNAVDEALNGWWTKSMKTHESRIEWWREAQFGMFVHWGIYSLPGGEWKGKVVDGYAEHLMRKEKISKAKYQEIAQRFNPNKFNAEEWILTAKKAGMRYFIVTAKHHDGFAMYPSDVSDFDIMDQTPFKRDPMEELAAVCRKYDMKFGFYYSHAFDWEHPDAAGNDWEYNNPGGDLNLYGGRHWYDSHPELVPKVVTYLNEKAIPQIKELIRKYHPDILWFDTPHKIPLSENLRVLKEIRETDPDIVINGRLARTGSVSFGDYQNTSDRPAEFYPVEGDWEAIPTTNESYGYNQHDHSHKPAAFFIQLLAKSASRDGNLLMNIGPMGNGAFDPTDLEILRGIGKWMEKNSESIYNTTKTSLPLQSWGVTTQKGDKLYLHVFRWPPTGKLVVGGLKSAISKAYFLADPEQQSLAYESNKALDLNISVPLSSVDTANTVIVLEAKGKIETDPVIVLSTYESNKMLAYDADLHGEGFGFGDGKPKRYYVTGWKNMDQWISWKVRVNEPVIYKIEIKYTASNESKGNCQLGLAGFKKQITIPSGQKNGEVYSKELGVVSLKPGVHHIKIEPIEIKETELMQLLEVELTPASFKRDK